MKKQFKTFTQPEKFPLPFLINYQTKPGQSFEVYMSNYPAGGLLVVLTFAGVKVCEVYNEPPLAIHLNNRFGFDIVTAAALADLICEQFTHNCPGCRKRIQAQNWSKIGNQLCHDCNDSAQPSTMALTFDYGTVENPKPTTVLLSVSSLRKGQEQWNKLRELKDWTSSTAPICYVVELPSEKRIARISYNGRIWDMEGKEIKLCCH